MSNKRCSNCYFGDKCRRLYACDNYSPIQDLTEDEVDEIIENGRREFPNEWNQYIKEYSD